MKIFKQYGLVFLLLASVACTETDSSTNSNNNGNNHTQREKSIIQSNLCLYGCPFKAGAEENNILVDHGILILSSNKKTKFADWVAYKVVKANIGGDATRRWKKDPKISNQFTLIPSDYKGANAKCDVDRGHQAPLASFGNTGKWEVTNYLSNITPQKSSLNRGSWVRLESAVRNIARKGREVFVITGTYYTGEPPCVLPAQRIESIMPNGYFKIVAVKEGGGLKMSQFLFPQGVAKQEDFCKYQSSLSKIEDITHLKFFPLKEQLDFDSLSKDLGC
ncbi:MAG: DNA/RNA non-specific endonuclease [Rickettsiales bacterium]|nr:DNA/RNA non-specific endonuclease [Rickettsiales bacterium]